MINHDANPPFLRTLVHSPDYRGVLLLSIFVVFLVQTGIFLSRGGISLIADPDAFLRLYRVQELYEHGDWFDRVLSRINPPTGHEHHWTRPFDALLLAGAWVGSHFVDFDTALIYWAMCVNPILHSILIVVLYWLVWPVFRGVELNVMSLVCASHVAMLTAYLSTRPDHQGLIFLLFAVSIGFGVRFLLLPYRVWRCYLGALFMALSLWVSVEAMYVLLIILLACGANWLFNATERIAQSLFHYFLGLALFVSIFIVLERGIAHTLDPELDLISYLYVTLFFFLAVFWFIAARIEYHGRFSFGLFGKLCFSAIGAVLLIGVMNAMETDFFRGPVKNVDPLYNQVRGQFISESQSLLPKPSASIDTWISALPEIILWLSPVLIAIPVVLWNLARRVGQRDWYFWLLLAIGIAFFGRRSGFRWVPYTLILSFPAYAYALGWLIEWIRRTVSNPIGKSVLSVGVLVLGAFWFWLPMLAVSNLRTQTVENHAEYPAVNQASNTMPYGCSVESITPFLADAEGLGARPRRIAAFVDAGPEILFGTPHFVYSVPNHRLQPGFNDTFNLLSATDESHARSIAEARRIELILICRGQIEERFYHALDADGRIFYDRLIDGDVPRWLRAIELPPSVDQNFRLFAVELAHAENHG